MNKLKAVSAIAAVGKIAAFLAVALSGAWICWFFLKLPAALYPLLAIIALVACGAIVGIFGELYDEEKRKRGLNA